MNGLSFCHFSINMLLIAVFVYKNYSIVCGGIQLDKK